MNEQFYILEILLAIIFLVILYFMLKEVVKKTIKKEVKEIKAPLEILANYLVQQSNEEEEEQQQPETTKKEEPPKKVEPPVDVLEEFVELKNANKISAYNLRVQKLWEQYKSKKITLIQYNKELAKLKKEYNIPDEATGT